MSRTARPGRSHPRRARGTAGAAQARSVRRWSGWVSAHSHALQLEPGVFTFDDPRRIARSLKRSADTSTERRSQPYRSAMSMLTFYLNRAGRGLSRPQRARLEAAKDELRALYGRTRGPSARR